VKTAIQLIERGLVPRPLVRRGIRTLLSQRLEEQEQVYGPDPQQALRRFVEHMREAPVALVPELANEQHYEVPPRFFELALGQRRKYSSCYYPSATTTLDEAEEAMLDLTCERAELVDGQEVLELGCGWGSLTLWMAEHYPNSRITAISNSKPQRLSILRRAEAKGLTNLTVLTEDMNTFEAPGTYDRVVSVEMFEHMRNWESLLGRVRRWLRDDGRVFLHVFAHRSYAYPFEVKDESDWMSRYFFSGGMMPSHDLIDHLEVPFEVDTRWAVNGSHYARTSEHWLQNMDDRKSEVMAVLRETYGVEEAPRWFERWRVFFLACAELFAWDGGNEWIVSHQRLKPTPRASS
jgi:cyclopropane-fatty-acyl-phospholipid synthase